MDHTTTTARSIESEKLASILSRIAADVTMKGDLVSESPDAGFALSGNFDGKIHFSRGGIVHIAKGATFTGGEIHADYVLIEGVVNASVHARRCVEITASAVVQGAITYDAELDIHKNARIRGDLTFTGSMDVVSRESVKAQPQSPAAISSTSPTAPASSPVVEVRGNVVPLAPQSVAVVAFHDSTNVDTAVAAVEVDIADPDRATTTAAYTAGGFLGMRVGSAG